MSRALSERIAAILPRYSLAAMLLVTGAVKVMALLRGGGHYLLPVWLLAAVAAIELLIGGFVLLSRRAWPVWGGVALGIVMLLSTLYMVEKGMDVRRCGCLGGVQGDALVHGAIALGLVVLGLLVEGERVAGSSAVVLPQGDAGSA